MTDSFDEAIDKIKYSGDFTDLDQQFGRFDDQAAAAYLRENFIPRARVERLLGIIELADQRDMLPRATVRTVIKDLLEK